MDEYRWQRYGRPHKWSEAELESAGFATLELLAGADEFDAQVKLGGSNLTRLLIPVALWSGTLLWMVRRAIWMSVSWRWMMRRSNKRCVALRRSLRTTCCVRPTRPTWTCPIRRASGWDTGASFILSCRRRARAGCVLLLPLACTGRRNVCADAFALKVYHDRCFFFLGCGAADQPERR